MRQLAYQVCYTRYHISFYLWLIGSVLKRKVPKYYDQDCRFHDVFSRDNLPKIKDEAYVTNPNDKQSEGTHWVSLFVDKDNAVYFDSLGIEYIPQEVLSKIKDKSITRKIFGIQDDGSIMCRFCFIVFIEYMFPGKNLLDHTTLFSPKRKIIYKYFKDKYGKP